MKTLKSIILSILVIGFSTSASATWLDRLDSMSANQVRAEFERNCTLKFNGADVAAYSDNGQRFRFVEQDPRGLDLLPGKKTAEEIHTDSGVEKIPADYKFLYVPPYPDSIRLDRIEIKVTLVGYPRHVKAIRLAASNLDIGGLRQAAIKGKDEVAISDINRDLNLQVAAFHPIDNEKPATKSYIELICRN